MSETIYETMTAEELDSLIGQAMSVPPSDVLAKKTMELETLKSGVCSLLGHLAKNCNFEQDKIFALYPRALLVAMSGGFELGLRVERLSQISAHETDELEAMFAEKGN